MNFNHQELWIDLLLVLYLVSFQIEDVIYTVDVQLSKMGMPIRLMKMFSGEWISWILAKIAHFP